MDFFDYAKQAYIDELNRHNEIRRALNVPMSKDDNSKSQQKPPEPSKPPPPPPSRLIREHEGKERREGSSANIA
jgi:hypothetical protein